MSEENKTDPKEMNKQINMNFFTKSMRQIVELTLQKSQEENIDILDPQMKQHKRKHEQHTKLRESCNIILNGLNGTGVYDIGAAVKKVYKVLTANIDYLHPDENIELFYLKDKNSIVTIIPGVDIGCVAKSMNIEEQKVLWVNIFMMYISSANLIAMINNLKREGKQWEIIPKLRVKVVESGLFNSGLLFNPFVGFNEDKGEYDMDALFANVDKLENPNPAGMGLNALLKMTGVDKIFDMDKLSEQIKDVDEEEIKKATVNLTNMIGAKGDNDTQELLTNLVNDVVKKLQSGEKDIFGIAQSVAMDRGKTVDPAKFMKTASKFKNFASQDHLSNLKDENGNPIGGKLMESLKGPLQFLQKMQEQQRPVPPFVEQTANGNNDVNSNNSEKTNNIKKRNKK
jgi:hypothetical protein